MTPPIDVFSSGAVQLGPDVVCDGFHDGFTVRVQSHIHSDHMGHFDRSKGIHDIVMTAATRDLIALEEPDLPYRRNIKILEYGSSYVAAGSRIELLSAGHMLGAAQVRVTLSDGIRVGYSGDFAWPIDAIMQVDALVLDATYGAPESMRKFSQAEAEGQLLALVASACKSGPVVIKAHRGTLHRSLGLLTTELDRPMVASERLCLEADVYRLHGFPIGALKRFGSYEAREAMATGAYIAFFGTGDQLPSDPLPATTSVVLSAYWTDSDHPVRQLGGRTYSVALSDHADFEGTLEYVRETGAKYVVTDNTRGSRAVRLALELTQRLGVTARPSSNIKRGEWSG